MLTKNSLHTKDQDLINPIDLPFKVWLNFISLTHMRNFINLLLYTSNLTITGSVRKVMKPRTFQNQFELDSKVYF